MCRGCGTVKPLDSFQRLSPTSRRGTCQACRNEAARGRYADNPEPTRAKVRLAYAAAPAPRLARQAEYRKANGPKLVQHTQAYRARKAAATIEVVDVVAVRASRSDCYLCGHELSGDIHMDHVVPLSRGGAHSNANLRPTHATCNLRKGDKLLSELKWYPPLGGC